MDGKDIEALKGAAVSPKRWYTSTNLCGVTTQKTVFFISTAVRTLNLTHCVRRLPDILTYLSTD
jgi:hypothetical protein